MDEFDEEYVSKARTAIKHAVREAWGGDGMPPAELVSQTLTLMLAEIMERAPGLNQPSDIRNAGIAFGKSMAHTIAEIRKLHGGNEYSGSSSSSQH